MANIRVKNNAGVEVIYNNIEQIVLPTTDGGTVVFKRWNGEPEINIVTTLHCLNINKTIAIVDTPVITTALVLS